MPIQLTHKLKRTTKQVRLKNSLFSNDAEWMAWWYCGIYKNNTASSQPNVLVAFRKLSSGKLSDDVKLHRVPLTALGQIRIGTVWKDRMCRSEAVFATEKFPVNFTKDTWKFTSFQKAFRENVKPPYPQNIHPLQYQGDKNWLIEFSLPTGGRLIVPCIEFYSRCFGRSEELKRVLATYPWQGEKEAYKSRLYAPLDEPEELPNKWKVKLRKRLVNGDIVFLAHAKYDPYTELVAKSIYAQIESRHDPEHKSPAFITVPPWFQGPAELKVRGIWFDSGQSFLALQILGCSDPVGAPIMRDRENTNKTDQPAEGGGIGEAWAGMPVRSLVKYPDIIDLTGDDEPDHGTATVEIQDPDFEVLGQSRVVIDVRRDRAKGSAGPRGEGTDTTTYSSGEPQGSGKGVGYASIHARPVMESHGVLRDMWNAMLFLENEKPELVQSVEWFTFEDGYSKNPEPKMIGLEFFNEDDEVSNKVRNWSYLDSISMAPRGILVARIMANGQPVHIVEIQRKPRKKKSDDGKVEDGEESYKGLVFVLDEQDQFQTWLRSVLSEIRHLCGIFKNLVGKCPGKAYAFVHKTAKHEKVPCEAAVINALVNIGATEK